MKDIKEILLKKSEAKPRSQWKCLVPGYIDEVRKTAVKNILIDFTHYEYLKN